MFAPEDQLWKLDRNLADFYERHHECELFSFDVFDTLIFRTVRRPADIFLRTGQTARERKLIKENITPAQYEKIRALAQRIAKTKFRDERNEEYKYEDIFAQMHPGIGNLEELRKLEFELEKDATYLNLSVVSLLRFLKESGKRVILASDMYFGREQLLEILQANGFDPTLVDDVLVSSDVNRTKFDGGMFDYILEKYGIEPEKIVHTGDNYVSDFVNAKARKFRAVYYDIFRNPGSEVTVYENLHGENLLPELRSLRCLAANLTANRSDEEIFYFNYGAMVLGPFFSLFTEWVLDFLEERRIGNLYPFMSEAVFFEKLLDNALRFRESAPRIQRLYLSRKSTYIAMLERFDEAFVDELLEKRKGFAAGGVLELFDLFGLYEQSGLPEELVNVPLGKLKTEDLRAFRDFLLSLDVLQYINDKIAEQKRLLLEYLTEQFDLSRFCTLDFGYKGTSASNLETVMKRFGIEYDCIHLLAVSTDNIKHNLINGLDFWSFYSSSPDNHTLINSIFNHCQIIESIINNDVLSTVGYRLVNGEIQPVFESKYDREELIRKKGIIQEGIFFFQNLLLNTFRNKRKTLKSIDPEGPLEVINRSFVLPTKEEAGKIGEFVFKNGFYDHSVYSFVPDDLIRKAEGVEQLINRQYHINELYWVHGAITKKDPYYLFHAHLDQLRIRDPRSNRYKAYRVLQKTLKSGSDEVFIYGAGQAGREIGKLLANFNVRIVHYIDSNPDLHGTVINDAVVVSLDRVFAFDCRTFVIGSYFFTDEIEKTILTAAQKWNEEVRIIKI
jgi:HAD superfamily hydrolase (TIGR01549 family)